MLLIFLSVDSTARWFLYKIAVWAHRHHFQLSLSSRRTSRQHLIREHQKLHQALWCSTKSWRTLATTTAPPTASSRRTSKVFTSSWFSPSPTEQAMPTGIWLSMARWSCARSRRLRVAPATSTCTRWPSRLETKSRWAAVLQSTFGELIIVSSLGTWLGLFPKIVVYLGADFNYFKLFHRTEIKLKKI